MVIKSFDHKTRLQFILIYFPSNPTLKNSEYIFFVETEIFVHWVMYHHKKYGHKDFFLLW